MDSERKPETREDPRGDADTAGGGYPEQQPAGSDDSGEGSPSGQADNEQPSAPATGSERDSAPGTATGNPAAAG